MADSLQIRLSALSDRIEAGAKNAGADMKDKWADLKDAWNNTQDKSEDFYEDMKLRVDHLLDKRLYA